METGPCVDEEEAAGKRLAWSPQPIMSGHQVAAVQSQRDISEKSLKNQKKGYCTEKKKKKKKKHKEDREKKKYLLTPIPCPSKGVLGPARMRLVDQSGEL